MSTHKTPSPTRKQQSVSIVTPRNLRSSQANQSAYKTPSERPPIGQLASPAYSLNRSAPFEEVPFRNPSEPTSTSKEHYVQRSARRVIITSDGQEIHDTTWAEVKMGNEKLRRASGLDDYYTSVEKEIAICSARKEAAAEQSGFATPVQRAISTPKLRRSERLARRREIETDQDRRYMTQQVKKRSVSVKRKSSSKSGSPAKKERSIRKSSPGIPSPPQSSRASRMKASRSPSPAKTLGSARKPNRN